MSLDLFSSYELLKVVKVQKSLPSFWLRFFPGVYNSQTDEIALDKVSVNFKRLAPFVAPNVQGRVMKKKGYLTVSFAPAYVKPKDVVDPSTDLVRQAGEGLGTASMTLEQRRRVVVYQLLERQRIIIDNREEWMAMKAIIDGKVVVAGEDYPSVTVDFRRDAALTVTLSGGAKWDQVSATPMADIMSLRRAINSKSGAVANNVIFGDGSWSNFYAKEIAGKEATLQNNLIRGSDVEISAVRDGFEGVEYMGRYKGSNGAGFDCWVYTAKYEDDNETLQDMMDTNKVVLVSESVQGVRCYGAIRDKRAGFQALKYFPKNWEIEDPSLEYLMTQSAPLPVPTQPDATGSIQTV
jgi:hypothetical protein